MKIERNSNQFAPRLDPVRRALFAFSYAALLLTSLPASATRFLPGGPGWLKQLTADSDFIVVAACTRTQEIGVLLYKMDFVVTQQLKGELKSFALELGEMTSPVFDTLSQPRPSLIFLKRGPQGSPELTTFVSAIALEGPDATLPAAIAQKLAIDKLPDGPAKVTALKQFILPLLVAPGDTYLKQNLAEDLLALHQSQPDLKLSDAELALILHAATNARSYRLAMPLALLLDQQGASTADAACLHALVGTDAMVADQWFRLAPVLAKRQELRALYVQQIEKTEDSGRAGRMLTQLYLVEENQLNPIYERLWQRNSATRVEVKYLLKQPTATAAQKQLLQRLSPGEP